MRKDLQKAVDLVRGGATYGEAAAALNLTRGQVAGACDRAGLRVGLSADKEKRRRARLRVSLNKPDVKQRQQLAMRTAWDKPERRERHSERMRQRWLQFRQREAAHT